MSRWIGPSPEHDHIKDVLDAAEVWRERCFMVDGSLFGEEALWTPANLNALKHRVVDDPIEGRASFYDKLRVQLNSASHELIRLAAEALWFVFLFLWHASMRTETKRERIKTVWQWSDSTLPHTRFMSDSVLRGVGNPGQAYMRFDRQLEFLLQVARQWKKLTGIEQAERLGRMDSPWRFVSWLDDNVDDALAPMRHAMLYLLFPDHMERIVSLGNKRQIVDVFGPQLPEEFSPQERKSILG